MLSIIAMFLALSPLPANARVYDITCVPASGVESVYRGMELVQAPVRVKSKKGTIKIDTKRRRGYLGSQRMALTKLAKNIYSLSTIKIPDTIKIKTIIIDINNNTFTLTHFKSDGPNAKIRQIYGKCIY
tara:strand:+ start:379 stop:765 length:387 start_codon:yes stop_codon:yes gene_type:complete